MKIVEVKWMDSRGTTRWDSKESYAEEAKKDLSITSIGYLAFESDDRVSIIQNVSPTSFDNMMTIPRIAVLSMKELD